MEYNKRVSYSGITGGFQPFDRGSIPLTRSKKMRDRRCERGAYISADLVQVQGCVHEMKAYGIKKGDDECCPGHAKYFRHGNTVSSKKTPRNKVTDKPRKARERQKKIDFE